MTPSKIIIIKCKKLGWYKSLVDSPALVVIHKTGSESWWEKTIAWLSHTVQRGPFQLARRTGLMGKRRRLLINPSAFAENLQILLFIRFKICKCVKHCIYYIVSVQGYIIVVWTTRAEEDTEEARYCIIGKTGKQEKSGAPCHAGTNSPL